MAEFFGENSAWKLFMDGVPKSLRRTVSTMGAGAVIVVGYFLFVANPLAGAQTKLEEHAQQISDHQKRLDEQKEVLVTVVQTLADMKENQVRQETLMQKLDDKLTRILERH